MDGASSDEQLLATIAKAEAAARRSRPLLLIGLLLLVAAFVSLSVYLNNARDAAERARDAAVAESLEKSGAANAAANALEAALLALQGGDGETAREIMRQALKKQEKVAGSPLPAEAADIRQSTAPIPVAQPEVASVLQQAAAEESGISLPAYPAGKAYKAYIQFAGNITRGDIVALSHALREAGWNVQGPSGERIGTAANLNEVRYSRDEDAEAARALALGITRTGIAGQPVKPRQLSIVTPGTLEVWISN